MGDLIRRADALQAIEQYCVGCNSHNGMRCRACNIGGAIDAVENCESVDAEPVKNGSNIMYTHPSDMFTCTECGFTCEITELRYDDDGMGEPDAYEYDCKFCPNCGEKMDGGD